MVHVQKQQKGTYSTDGYYCLALRQPILCRYQHVLYIVSAVCHMGWMSRKMYVQKHSPRVFMALHVKENATSVRPATSDTVTFRMDTWVMSYGI